MHDPYAGHRNYESPWWQPDPARHTQWTEWDYVLLEAHETIKMLQSPMSGQMRNISEDPEVSWEIGYRVDYGLQELERFEKENEPEPGVQFFLTNPTKRDGKPFWTVTEWLEDIEKGDPVIDRSAPDGAHAPTPEELAEIRARRLREASAE
jgi:hypothetical protein